MIGEGGTVYVASGLLLRGDRALLTQRRAGKQCPFLWETPGGKVEGNESYHDCVRRELREELGVEVGALPEHGCVVELEEDAFSAGLPPVHLICYGVTEWAGEPRPLEGQGIGWFTAEEMRRLTLAPCNRRGIEDLVRMVEWSARRKS